MKVPGFPYKFSATPPRIDRGAPLTGEHTREILSEAGLDNGAIEELFASGTVAETS